MAQSVGSPKVPKCQSAKVPKCQGRVTSWYSYQSNFSGREKDRQPESLGLYTKSEASNFSGREKDRQPESLGLYTKSEEN